MKHSFLLSSMLAAMLTVAWANTVPAILQGSQDLVFTIKISFLMFYNALGTAP